MIRKDTDHAFQILLYLGLSVPTKPVSAERIAGQLQIPKSFAQKILHKLVAAEILAAKPGGKGGFVLEKEPKAISMMAVVEAVQGSMLVSACATDQTSCLRSVGCPVRPRWSKLQNKLNEILFRITLADLLKSRQDISVVPTGRAKTQRQIVGGQP